MTNKRRTRQVYASPPKVTADETDVHVEMALADVEEVVEVHRAIDRLCEMLSPYGVNPEKLRATVSQVVAEEVKPGVTWPDTPPERALYIREVLGEAQYRLWRAGCPVRLLRDYLSGQAAQLEALDDAERHASRRALWAKRDEAWSDFNATPERQQQLARMAYDKEKREAALRAERDAARLADSANRD